MERIILIETSTALCSAALAEDGAITAYRESSAPKAHASLTAVFIQEILTERGISLSDCDAVCVSMGPGSYTGLRVGVSTAKTHRRCKHRKYWTHAFAARCQSIGEHLAHQLPLSSKILLHKGLKSLQIGSYGFSYSVYCSHINYLYHAKITKIYELPYLVPIILYVMTYNNRAISSLWCIITYLFAISP